MFTLPQGNYRFRADQGGAQYWSDAVNDCTVPGCTGAAMSVLQASLKQSLIRAGRFGAANDMPCAGRRLCLMSGSA